MNFITARQSLHDLREPDFDLWGAQGVNRRRQGRGNDGIFIDFLEQS